MIHISKDGTGDFTSIQAALDSLPTNNREEIVLFLHKGIYREQVTVRTPHVTFLGEDENSTILTYGLSAREILADGTKRGTFRTYSCLIDANNFKASGLTFVNSSGSGPDAGQALAAYADGDWLCFHNCRFLGGQDTLFTGPLPPTEIEPGGFTGPKQHASRVNGRHYYKNCYFEGDIDFIFGSATAYFEECEFFSKEIGRKINGYVTAASTPEGQSYGYVMKNCRFTGNCRPGSVYLGRPWREYAKTVLINCCLGPHIHPAGWDDWGKTHAHDTVYYAEYGSYGPGAEMDQRPGWVRILTEKDLPKFEKDLVLGKPCVSF